MKIKIFALIAVLALVIGPLLIIAETDIKGEGEENASVDLQAVYESETGTYWVNCTVENKTMTISNNPNTPKIDSDIDLTASEDFFKKAGVEKITFADNFSVVYGMALCDKDVYFKQLELKDTCKITSKGDGKLISSGDVGNVLGGNGTADCTFVLDNCQVNCDYMNFTKELKLCTTPGETALVDTHLIAVNDGSSNVIKLFAVELMNLILDGEINSTVKTTGELTCALTGAITKNIGGRVPYIGIRSVSEEGKYSTAEFKDLSLSDLDVAVMPNESGEANLLFGNADHKVDYTKNNVVFNIKGSNISIGSLSGMTDISFVDQTGTTKRYIVDEEGNTYHKVTFSMHEGIEGIDAQEQFVKNGDTIDLTKVNVTCKSGYKFVGWFYTDTDGKIKEVTDLEHFKPESNVDLFAMAAPGEDPVPPVSGGDTNMTLLIITAVLVAIVGVASVIIVASRH